MEGFLLVPPDRPALIGRVVWKPRYLVFGLAGNAQQVENITASHRQSQPARSSILKSCSSKQSLPKINCTAVDQDSLVLSIYKHQGDPEPIQQYPLSRLKSIDVQTIQHPKKAGHATPTLIIHLALDAAAEKLRKRRSSRTGGLSSSTPLNVLYFRTPDNERYNVYDWQMTIQPLVQMSLEEEGHEEELDNDGLERRRRKADSPMSPLSPLFSQFANANPFSGPRPTTSSANRATLIQPKGSDHTFSSMQNSRDKQTQMASPESSLRSKRSDLSSQASTRQKPFSTYYSSTLPSTSSDLPSPNSNYDITDQDGQFVEGWRSAQVTRSGSGLSSHTKNSNSINSPTIANNSTNMASSPIPRESILDRAFQMRYIPGSEKITGSSTSHERELSSIARFEALMRKADEEKARIEEQNRAQSQKSGWELDEESEEDSDSEGVAKRHGKILDDDDVDPLTPPKADIPPPAKRALDYISARPKSHFLSHSPHNSISPLSPPPPSQYYRNRPYSTTATPQTQTNSTVDNAVYSHEGVKFQDSFETAGGRPSMSRQNSDQSKRSGHRRPLSVALPPSRSFMLSSADPDFSFPTSGVVGMDRERENQRNAMERSHTTGHVHRLSTTSISGTTAQAPPSNQGQKRLSFTEFTRRLSSTSSLLLVRTNTNLSSSSGRVSSSDSWRDSSSVAGNEEFRSGGLRHSAIGMPRENGGFGFGYGRDAAAAGAGAAVGSWESRDGNRSGSGGSGLSRDENRCGWRGSVGVFGGEGGFL